MGAFVLIFCSIAVVVAIAVFFLGLIKPAMVGVKSRARAVMMSFCIFVIALAVVIFTPVATTPEQNAAEASLEDSSQKKALDFILIEKTDISTASRRRVNAAIISPTAKTKAERADIVMHVAKLIQKETAADVVSVFLEPSEKVAGFGGAYAYATYIPSGCGQNGKECGGNAWDVNSSDTQISAHEMEIWEAWVEHREKFIKDGYLDEENLQEFLSKKFKTDPEQITIPVIFRDKISF